MENELENTTTTETMTENTTTTDELLQGDAIALAYDYYDQYYEKVLDNMDTMLINQSTIIENQEKVIEQNTNFNLLLSTIVFFLGLTYISNIVRNMIKRS